MSKPAARSRGRLFVISAPSGAGKTSLVRSLMAQEPGLRFSVSCTTRPKRENEVEGRDYFFIPGVEEFKRMAAAGDFLEHARVFDNYYATPRRPVEKALAEGQDLILEIDWQGARQVRALYPDCVGIFILPPSVEELERRMRARAQDTEAVIRQRMDNAREELSHAGEFQYAIINKDFETAKQELAEIIRKERAKPHGAHHR